MFSKVFCPSILVGLQNKYREMSLSNCLAVISSAEFAPRSLGVEEKAVVFDEGEHDVDVVVSVVKASAVVVK